MSMHLSKSLVQDIEVLKLFVDEHYVNEFIKIPEPGYRSMSNVC